MSNFNYSYSPTFKQLNPDEHNVQDFVVNKLWQINQDNYSSSYGVLKYNALYPDYNSFPNGLIALNSSKYTSVTSSGQDVHILWHYIYSNYYNGDYSKFDLTKDNLVLYQSASLLAIPTDILSEGIKVDTLSITASGITINDDAGNLIDSSYDTSSFIDNDYLIGYWGFNDKYNSLPKQYNYSDRVLDLAKNNHGYINGVDFTPGINTHGIVSSSGLRADFNSNDSIQIKNDKRYNFKVDDDFSLSVWVNLPDTQEDLGNNYNSIISKRTVGTSLVFDQGIKQEYNVSKTINVAGYPFDISVYNSNDSNDGLLRVSRKGGSFETILSSSVPITGSDNHIVFQKTGSTLELYINGSLDGSITDATNGNTVNKSDIWIGSPGVTAYSLSGSVDEFRIYNRGLNESEVFSLYSNDYNTGSAYQTNLIGNCFYKMGQVIVSDPRPKYGNLFDGNFNVDFRNKYRIYEHEVLLKLREGDFNLSLNPTLRVGETEDSQQLKSFVTGSWKPYITTIGLYNQNYELLAVARLAKPVEKRDDVPMNFIVRFDI